MPTVSILERLKQSQAVPRKKGRVLRPQELAVLLDTIIEMREEQEATVVTNTTTEFGVFGESATQQTALTAADATAANSGDSGTDDVIDNIRTRVGEIEAVLVAFGFIAAPE